ncbi:MAG: hypothetical protein NVS3B16_22310 [Vulcanimicrobiaceae bacterium]
MGSPELFFVRYWSERDSAGLERWRGSIEHVGHALKLFVNDPRDIGDIIALRLAAHDLHGNVSAIVHPSVREENS